MLTTSRKVLVLNQDYQALGLCSAERAFVLVYLDKAELLHTLSNNWLHTVSQRYPFPSVIRLLTYVPVPYRKVSLSRANVLRRDGNRCMYCGSRNSLTVDHIVPRSIGGPDSWENLVAACQRCNTRKGNRSLKDSGLVLSRKPSKPSYLMFLADLDESLHESWKPYLMI